MLIPHNPSQHLHRSGQVSRERQSELDDVYIVELPGEPEPERPAARAVPSGRSARLNLSQPPA